MTRSIMLTGMYSLDGISKIAKFNGYYDINDNVENRAIFLMF